MTFVDKYETTVRPVQFHWHVFSGHTAIQITRELQGRIMFMSMFNDIEYWIKDNHRTCVANAAGVSVRPERTK